MSPPTEIAGRYTIESRLGAGGMSTVFLAQDTVLERPVAIKLLAEHLADDEAFVARFRREALAAARLQHPNIVQVFDSGLDQPSHRHFIVMELVDGPSAADMLRDEKRLDIEEAVGIVRDACHGLDYAHRGDVVHRDVKPGNLLMSSETGTVKLADFGIAKAAAQTRITQVGSVLGTAAYLSPEQARGDEAGPPSDIYSLGVCAYQFLAGRLPHEYASLTELALKQQEEAVQPIAVHRPDVPDELDRAIRVCLERDPEHRYASALDFARAIDAGIQGFETEATRRLSGAAGAAAAGDADATRALAEVTAATEALRTRGQPARPPIAPQPPRGRAADPARADQRATKKAKRRRRWGTFLAVLAVLMAVAAVAIAVLSSGGGSSVSPVDQGDVQGQVEGIKQFLQDHTR
jgi:eukaryotic-like serine/threonine-protein kinase